MVPSILILWLVSSQKNNLIPSDLRGFFIILFPMTAIEFLRFIVSALILKTDAIEISEKQDELGTLLSLRVDPSDMGSLIGR